MPRKRKLVSIQKKLIVGFVTLVFGIILVTSIIQYTQRSRQLLYDTQQEVIRLAAAAVLLIDGEDHYKVTTNKEQTSETYQRLKKSMLDFQKATGVTYIYTLIEKDQDTTLFIVDAADEGGANLGYEYMYLPAMKKAFEGIPAADENMYTDEWGTFLSGYAPIKNSDGKIIGILGLDIDAQKILEKKRHLLISIAINTILSILLTLIFSFFLSQKIIRPLNVLAERFKELSLKGGDLTQKIHIKTGDELEYLGDAITEFITHIRGIVEQVINHSKSVAGSAERLNGTINENQKAVEEVNTAILNMASGASEQSSNINDIHWTIQKIAAKTHENEKKVGQINYSVAETKHLIKDGVEAVTNQNIKTTESMNAFKRVSGVVEKLTKEANEVGSILETITHISEQTNLLALNAAIEAARAGENGKGFSVVAQEVRKLADGSSAAAKESRRILQRIESDVKEVVEEMNDADRIAKEQKLAVDSASLTFEKLTQEIEKMMEHIYVISTSFKEVDKDTNSMANKIQDIASVSQENAAIAEEISAHSEQQRVAMKEIGVTAEALQELSQNLNQMMFRFKV